MAPHRRGWRSFAAVALAVGAVGAGCRVPDPKPGDTLPVGYVAPPVEDIRTAVAYGPDDEHLVDLYLPPAGAAPTPVLVWIHGGGWMAGTRSEVPELLLRQVDLRGWAVASADYRLVTWDGSQYGNTHPSASHDLDRLVRWLKAEAAGYGIDPDRIVLVGGSAGGQLAALAGVAPGLHVDPTLPPELAGQSPAVAGVVAASAPLDLEYMVGAPPQESSLPRAMLGCPVADCDPEVVAAASPRHQLRPDSAPMFVAAGDLDTIVPPAFHAVPFHTDAVAAVAARDDEAAMPSIWFDQIEQGDHNLDHTTINVRYLEQWLDLVAKEVWVS